MDNQDDDEHKKQVYEKRKYEEEDFVIMSQKFPYITSEIFCCDINSIIAPIVHDNELLSRFFQILDQPSPLDPRMAGYFHKVLSVLIRHDPEAVLKYVLEYPSNDSSSVGIVSKLLCHIDSYSISNCFMIFLLNTEQQIALHEEVDDQDAFDDVFSPIKPSPDSLSMVMLLRSRDVWSGGEGTIKQVLHALKSAKNSDSCSNAADLLSDMFRRASLARKGKKQRSTI